MSSITLQDYLAGLGIEITSLPHLEQALTHRSFVHEQKVTTSTAIDHNERLEFLGDAVLELVTTELLFHTYPKEPEGKLTAYRSSIVNTDMLSRVGRSIGVEQLIKLSHGEAKQNETPRDSIIADTVEAVIGALYLDMGYDVTKTFVSEAIFSELQSVVDQGSWIDAKSRLQELAQEKLSVTPTYKTHSAEGPDHEKTFYVGVYFAGNLVAKGQGPSKRAAEQDAAEKAVESQGWSLSAI